MGISPLSLSGVSTVATGEDGLGLGFGMRLVFDEEALLALVDGGSGGGVRVQRLVGSWIYALADQLLAEVSVPVILYLIVCTSWNSPSYQRPPNYPK
ncbi:hypothetical protein SLA2020_415030 [Shorea laevis]